MIKHILIVPAEGDPHGLLAPVHFGADYQYGFAPPSAHRPALGGGGRGAWTMAGADSAGGWLDYAHPEALVVAWGGKPVEEGIDRALRVTSRYLDARTTPGKMRTSLLLLSDYCMADLPRLAAQVVERLGGEVVVIEGENP